MTKIYQPQTRNQELPNGLFSWQVFKTREHARQWLTENADPEEQYDIIEYDELDIEDYEFVKVGDPIYYLYCGWEEHWYGSSDPTTHDCSVLFSYRTLDGAREGLKEQRERIIEDIKGELKEFNDYEEEEPDDRYDHSDPGFEFREEYFTEKTEKDYYKATYDNGNVRLMYNVFIQEGELL